MYDVIIIGSGPAGMTAGIYATRRAMKTLIVGQELGGQLVWASEIENYPGFKLIGSFDLIEKIKEQTLASGAEMKNGEVKAIVKQVDGTFIVKLAGEDLQAKTVILTLGLSPRRLAIPGEAELSGRGVSYCANCDGPFYKEKEVAVIGGGNSALDAAELMSKIAKKVYLIHRSDTFKAFESLVEEVKSRSNIEIITNADTQEILGKEKVNGLKILDKTSGREREISLDGVFVEIGRIAKTDLVADLVDRDRGDQILVNNLCETKTPGLFAAGDVTDCVFKQITIAMGQATTAALAAYQYLQLKK